MGNVRGVKGSCVSWDLVCANRWNVYLSKTKEYVVDNVLEFGEWSHSVGCGNRDSK